MDKNYGTVALGGTTYTLTDQAVCDNYGTDGLVRYYAHAVDAAGNEYRVAWDTTDQWDLAQERAQLAADSDPSDEDAERLAELEAMVLPDCTDESNACDWAAPVQVRLV